MINIMNYYELCEENLPKLKKALAEYTYTQALEAGEKVIIRSLKKIKSTEVNIIYIIGSYINIS